MKLNWCLFHLVSLGACLLLVACTENEASTSEMNTAIPAIIESATGSNVPVIDEPEADEVIDTGIVEKAKSSGVEEEDEEEEGDGDEEGCDSRLSSVVRNFDSTPFLPDDYTEAAEMVTQTDLVHRQYNITDMMSIVQRLIDYTTKLSKSKDLADTGRVAVTLVFSLSLSLIL